MEALKPLREKLRLAKIPSEELFADLRRVFVSKEYGLLDDENEEKKGLIRDLNDAVFQVEEAKKKSHNTKVQHLKILAKKPWNNEHILSIVQEDNNVVRAYIYDRIEPDECRMNRLDALMKHNHYEYAFIYAKYLLKNYQILLKEPESILRTVKHFLHLILHLRRLNSSSLMIPLLTFKLVHSLDADKADHEDSEGLKEKKMKILFRIIIEKIGRSETIEQDLIIYLSQYLKGDPDLFVQVRKGWTKPELLFFLGRHLQDRRELAEKSQIICVYLHGIALALVRIEDADLELKKRMEADLAPIFANIADLLRDSRFFYRESLLTSFTLHPTDDILLKIVEIGRELPKLSNPAVDKDEPPIGPFSPNRENFESALEALVTDLETAKKLDEERTALKNEQMVAIQGSALHNAISFNLLKDPTKINAEGLSESLISDLILAISAPRWHMVSWVLEWSVLEEKCRELLANPGIKYPCQELKNLVVDYAQFEEYSSEEELDVSSGIEKGYESWSLRRPNSMDTE